jgi:hypothetical protein
MKNNSYRPEQSRRKGGSQPRLLRPLNSFLFQAHTHAPQPAGVGALEQLDCSLLLLELVSYDSGLDRLHRRPVWRN